MGQEAILSDKAEKMVAPKFGDIITNGWASEENPMRVGYFVREGRRTGRMNPGAYFEVTDGAGKFWELPLDRDHKITVQPAAATLERVERERAATLAQCIDADRENFANAQRANAAEAQVEALRSLLTRAEKHYGRNAYYPDMPISSDFWNEVRAALSVPAEERGDVCDERPSHHIAHASKLMGAAAEESSSQAPADEFAYWLEIVRDWSGSAFLAGEKVEDEGPLKAALYHDLCRLGNYLMSWRDEARKPAVCETCNGRGEIGGWVGQTAESGGWETEPCPDCTAPSSAPARSARPLREQIEGVVYPWAAERGHFLSSDDDLEPLIERLLAALPTPPKAEADHGE